MKQALQLAKSKTLEDALAQVLEFEAVKRASKNKSRVREVKAEIYSCPEFYDDLVKKVVEKLKGKRNRSRSGQVGHLRTRCGKLQNLQQPSKLKRVDVKGQPSTRKIPAPKTAKVASVRQWDGGICVDGQVNGKSHVFLYCTNASKTIVKPSVVKKTD